MDWNDLRHFLAVARAGGLSAAARNLGASQATIGRRIQALEASLGVVLFERLATGYVLTPTGREILARAETAEAAILAVARGADAERGELEGPVRLATGEHLASHLVAPHAPRLRALHPRLRLEFLTGMRVASLTRRDADLSLRIVRPDQGDLVRRRVGRVAFSLYVASETLSNENPDPWAMPAIGWSEALRDVPLATWLRERARGPVVAAAANTSVQLALARAGLGAALLPCFVADAEPGLARLIDPSDAPSFDLWLVAHRDLSRAPRVRVAMEFIGDVCAREAGRLRGAG